MASRNSKKSSGLRLLWIPGGRKSHPKGRFSSTNKQVSYTTRQKKSEVWSLGGSKAQQNLLQADPDISALDGPSTSGLTSLACAATASGATAAASSTKCLETPNLPDATSEKSTLYNNQHQLSPTTPNSSTSTATLISPPQSPFAQNIQLNNNSTQPSITDNTTTTTMPAKYYQPIPVLVTATTTDNIMEGNRFSLLAGKDIVTNELDIYALPSPPINNINSQENLNNSSGTTISQITPSGSPRKTDNESSSGSANNSPARKKQQQRNHNNNQGDVNSIESITEDDTTSEKIPSGNLDWVDEVVQERQDREMLKKPKKKKKKKKNSKELDQLDGIPMKGNSAESIKEEDEKVVKCLYYTLMCCDCTIS